MCFCNCNTLKEATGAVLTLSSGKTALHTNEEEPRGTAKQEDGRKWKMRFNKM